MASNHSLSLSAVALVLLLTVLPTRGQHPAVPTPVPLAGLIESVEIIRDRWGIAHIYAKNEHDLFFVQGYNAARDRLFQFEVWRRQATGTIAEILGRKELKRDLGTRLHLFRGNLKQELNFYHPRGEQIVAAFVAGVNAYIELTQRNPALLPLEFKLLDIRPGRWSPEVVISRHQALLTNIRLELSQAQAVRILGPEKVKDLSFFQGGDPLLTVDPAIELSLISNKILELYDAFREPIKFTPQDIMLDFRIQSASLTRSTSSRAAALQAMNPVQSQEDFGSNNWILSGKLTQSGKPMMMNDPHRTLSAPSLRYWVHLVAPGWNVIGAGEPVLPGVSVGHNEHGAWGLTHFGIDTEDLYVYDTHPADPSRYKYAGVWKDMRRAKDTISVKDQAPVAVELKYTRHGPVLFEDTEHHKAYALRAAWMEVGCAPYLASLRMNQAKNWLEFREACTYNRIPAENMVWAGVDGTIGYQAAGIQPLRPNWSGLVPVPGDGRYEWAGYLPIKELPHAVDPPQGFFVTANHYLFPDKYPFPAALHYTWADPYRADRITEVLSNGRAYAVADMIRLQNDDLSIPARMLVPLLTGLPLTDPLALKTCDLVVEWNYLLDRNSVPAGIYTMWQRRLEANMRDLLVPKEAQEFVTLAMKRIIDWLITPDGRFGADPVRGRNELLVRSFEEATAELARKLGPDVSRWQYGQEKYHHVLIHHPLSEAVLPELRFRLSVGPLPKGGDRYTVTATGDGDNQTTGPSFMIIADAANWDNSMGLNTPGQSGDPDSSHYRDLFEPWSQGHYFPVFYSRAKVESVAEERVMLVPVKVAK
jgi:penicillin G amidase